MANNLKVFDTIQDYENATIENNSVSYIKEDNSIRYSGGVEHTVQAPITSVKVNGESITTDADGNIDIGNIQEQLVSGTNIKTVNNQSILGGGNIEIISGSSNDANVMAVDTSETLDDVSGSTYVKYTIQVLTDAQKQQARDNIGAMSADAHVSVDLSNYYTKEEINSQIGDINSVLEDIISGGGGSSLITFTIDGTEYQAEKGMTWREWCNSEYNIDSFGFEPQMGWVTNIRHDYIVYLGNTIAGLDETILQNANYVLKIASS